MYIYTHHIHANKIAPCSPCVGEIHPFYSYACCSHRTHLRVLSKPQCSPKWRAPSWWVRPFLQKSFSETLEETFKILTHSGTVHDPKRHPLSIVNPCLRMRVLCVCGCRGQTGIHLSHSDLLIRSRQCNPSFRDGLDLHRQPLRPRRAILNHAGSRLRPTGVPMVFMLI